MSFNSLKKILILPYFILVMGVLTIGFAYTPAFAFYTVQDTGDILAPDESQFIGELQFVTSGDDGVNVIGRYDLGFDEDSNIRFMVGAGTTDFQFGAFYKWVPYPDYENQPAIGFILGAHYARYEAEEEVALRFTPLISKQYESEVGTWEPYLSVPVSLQIYDSKTNVPVQFVIGSRYKHPDYDDVTFSVELGFKIEDAISYISFGTVF